MGGRTRGGCQPMNSKGAELNAKTTKRFRAIGILSGYRTSKFKRKKK